MKTIHFASSNAIEVEQDVVDTLIKQGNKGMIQVFNSSDGKFNCLINIAHIEYIN